MGLGCILALPP